MLIEGMEVSERRGRREPWRRWTGFALIVLGVAFLVAAAGTDPAEYHLRRSLRVTGLGCQLAANLLVMFGQSPTSRWLGVLMAALWIGLAGYWLLQR